MLIGLSAPHHPHHGHHGSRRGGRGGVPFVVYSEPYVVDEATAYDVDPQDSDDEPDTNGLGALSSSMTAQHVGWFVAGVLTSWLISRRRRR
jgi:hypothetical protein